MGVDVHAKLRGHVSPREIGDYIKERYNVNIYSTVQTENRGKIDKVVTWPHKAKRGETNWKIQSGFIDFTVNLTGEDEQRNLFYMYDNVKTEEDINWYKEHGMPELVKMAETETTYLSLGLWGSAVEIMLDIVQHFGGWIDENDCDDIPYYYVRKRPVRK